jgi:hypothetical protein
MQITFSSKSIITISSLVLHSAAVLGLLLGINAMRPSAGLKVRVNRQPTTGLAGLGLLLGHVPLLAAYNIAPTTPRVKEEVVKKMSRRADEFQRPFSRPTVITVLDG